MTTRRRFLHASLLAGAVGATVPALAKEPPPEVTPDGLVLRKGKVADVLYVRPDADFGVYRRVAILECPVAFRKNWERDQERSGKRIRAEDMDAIRKGLSEEFRKVFVDELQAKGGYEVVTSAADDVLVIRPAIIDLDVSAPDTLSAGRSYTLSESAGAMTLYIELFDSVTGQILARAADRRSATGIGRIQWRNGVSNRAEADRVLRRWASALRERLDEVKGPAPAG